MQNQYKIVYNVKRIFLVTATILAFKTQALQTEKSSLYSNQWFSYFLNAVYTKLMENINCAL